MNKGFCLTLLNIVGLFLLGFSSWVSASEVAAVVSEAQVVAKYNYIINILTMLLVGFGFLMVFVRRYGFGAVTGTYLVVAGGAPPDVGQRRRRTIFDGVRRHNGFWKTTPRRNCDRKIRH